MTIVLHNEVLRLTVDPVCGAGILACAARVGNDWLPLMPDVRDPGSDLDSASFLMIPYSNRVENGAFTFAGASYQLAGLNEHAIHGDVRKRSWQVAAQDAESVHCSFASTDFEQVNWPWPFAAQAGYRLSGRSLYLELSLTNQGGTAMPAGFGWHPYFSRALTRAGEPVALEFPLEGVYPDADDTRIPSGPLQLLAACQDFATERLLEPGNFLDACCFGFTGGHIAWPESGVRLRFEPAANCRHLVLFNPTGKPYFAVEPVLNANNGVNLLAAGDTTAGTIVLEPGATLESNFTLHLEVTR